MKIYLLILFFLPLFALSQVSTGIYNLSATGSTIDQSMLYQLDSVFNRKRLIGMGESTHGTSEFTVIRGDIFKYLVQKHNYTVFFLEADFNACSRINRYIHGMDDDVREAVLELRLWPWLTQEMLDLVDWMREYNAGHENVLEFFGCDMQLIKDDQAELPRTIDNNALSIQLPDLKFDVKDTSTVMIKQKEWETFSNAYRKKYPDSLVLEIKTVDQWFESALSKNTHNFRDSCMGNNIADFLEQYPNKKGIYFAHNGHVGKITNHYKENNICLKRAGTFLYERLQDDYYAMALEFNVGSFNAINFKDDQNVMEYFMFNKSDRNSLSRFILQNEDKIKYIESRDLSSKKSLKICNIGALYGKTKLGYKVYRYRNLEKDDFDGYLVINKGTPTHLLTMTSKAHD